LSCKASNPYLPHQVDIIKIVDETHDTRTFGLTFSDPEIKEHFSFRPGQFNMVTLFGIGEAPISISSDHCLHGYFEHTVRKVGNVTKAMFRLQEGDNLRVRGPYGRGWPVELAEGKNILIVAGGIGLAPLRPLIYTLIENRSEFGNVEILYGARTPLDALFINQWDEWSALEGVTFLPTVDGVPSGVKWDYGVGLVTKLFDSMASDPGSTLAVMCGPEIMMKFAVQGLLEKGFASKDIFLSLERRMNCGISKCGFCQIGPKYVCQDGPVFSYHELQNLTEKVF
jgi:NAD(P)H-flavin reductase